MKKLFSSLVMVILLPLMLFSFMKKGEKNSSDNQKNAKNAIAVMNNTYSPGETWELTWSDEFNKKKIDRKNWNFQKVEAGRFNAEWQRYTKSSKNAYIEDGHLVIKAIHESDVHGIDQYTSARLNTANKFTFKYGKIAARIKLPEGEGIWPAFWMLGANINENGGDTPWPQSGEIDILELYGSKDDGVVEANAHYADASGSHAHMGAASYKLKEGKFSDAFHIFELEWNAKSITWFVDGEQFASMPISASELSEFHEEFFILLNIAVGGTHAGRPDATSTFPQFMYIDWIRVYKEKE